MNWENQRVRFGKYKGRFVSWVIENDFKYAKWLAYKSNSTTKTKRAAMSLIDKKKNNENKLEEENCFTNNKN